jgi:hypothetical protein
MAHGATLAPFRGLQSKLAAQRNARKIMLLVHVPTSMSLLGAVLSFLVLAVAGLQGVVQVYPAAGFIATYVILPLAIAALVFGMLQSLVSPYGLFRHYWVVIKLALTLLVLAVLLLQLPNIRAMAEATPMELARDNGGRASLVLHAAAGMGPLLLATALSVLKPQGLTKYGWRKHQRQDARTS